MISQLYVLSPRGDAIICRELRGDIAKGTAEIFFRHVKFCNGDPPPVLNIDGVNFAFVKRNGLYFVATTNYNISAGLIIEFLHRFTKVLKDFCGVLCEDGIRKNFILVYEILDEMLDFGYPQLTRTELLKFCVRNEAQLVDSQQYLQKGTAASVVTSAAFPRLAPKTVPSNATHRPIGVGNELAASRQSEIFVDILERITVVLSPEGSLINSSVEGSIQMKSFLSGSPQLKLALNEDIVLRNLQPHSSFGSAVRSAGRGTAGGQRGSFYGGAAIGTPTSGGGSSVVIDDCNFHDCVDLRDFDNLKILQFRPPDGEFVVMNYRAAHADFNIPFKIRPSVEEKSPTKLDLVVRLRAEIPQHCHGGNVVVACSVPKATSSASLGAVPSAAVEKAEYNSATSKVVWNLKQFQGGSECTLRASLLLSQPLTKAHKKEVGPVTLDFEIPMYNVTNLQVRYLRISEANRTIGGPYRWVRYVTQSASYICRL
eukprot:Lankesteria_metandrocarpae@DN9287_c0_g1_i1.p1